ncbi:unnamed protein product [Cuscuta campestris]|uniref:Pentacotripeptide-repeat region of PRORP domain-containing protein n=1 Tax=Cuscuta campestris TaxID=132261 RepID=A0A484KPI0_9ASTE|nr:unnamed protein product [Cuscuta campestris]
MPYLPPQARIFSVRPGSDNLKRRPCLVQKVIDLCSQGHFQRAVDSLDSLADKGLRLDSKTIAFLLQKCADSKSIAPGKCVHLHLKLTGRRHPNTFIANHLISMYRKCGDLVNACKVFDKLSVRNLYSWNAMLSGYAKLGMTKAARDLFDEMPEKNMISWNVMVTSYAQGGYLEEAVNFYRESRVSSSGIDEYTFAGVVTVCVKAKELNLTRQVHCQVLVAGFLSNLVLSSSILAAYASCGEMGDATRLFGAMRSRDVVTWTTLVAGYGNCGDMKSAREVFDMMPEKNSVSWTALMDGYARNGFCNEAITVFAEMMKHQVAPDRFSFSVCMSACASIPSLNLGKQIHALVMVTGFRPTDTTVLRCLVDMYSKCGSLEDAQRVSDFMGRTQNVASGTQHCYVKEAT